MESKYKDGIKTSADLRGLLADTMVKVFQGVMHVDKAVAVTRLASQVNESFYSEMKIARTMVQLKREDEVAALGELPIGKGKPKE